MVADSKISKNISRSENQTKKWGCWTKKDFGFDFYSEKDWVKLLH